MSASSAESELTVVLVKAGKTKIRYPAALVADDGTRVTVRAPWAAPGSATSASYVSSRVTSSRSTTGATPGSP